MQKCCNIVYFDLSGYLMAFHATTINCCCWCHFCGYMGQILKLTNFAVYNKRQHKQNKQKSHNKNLFYIKRQVLVYWHTLGWLFGCTFLGFCFFSHFHALMLHVVMSSDKWGFLYILIFIIIVVVVVVVCPHWISDKRWLVLKVTL